MKKQVFVEVNVEGLDVYSGDRLVEVACVEVVDFRLTGRVFHYSDRSLQNFIVYGDEKGAFDGSYSVCSDSFSCVVSDFLDFCSDAEVVCHDLELTRRYIDSELERAGKPYLNIFVLSVTDGQAVARQKFPCWRRDLDSLSRYLAIGTISRNLSVALDRARLFSEIYQKLLALPNRSKPEYLESTDWRIYMVDLCRTYDVTGRILFLFDPHIDGASSPGAHFRFEISDVNTFHTDAKWFRHRVIETVTLMFNARQMGENDAAAGGDIILSVDTVTIDWLARGDVSALMSLQ